jgi:hypothetical protein
MKLKDLDIIGLEVIGNIALSVIDKDKYPCAIPDANLDSIISGTVCEIVTKININGDLLTWENGVINLDQEI